jgi:hypothetical protein
MLISGCGTLLSGELDSTDIVPPEGSPLAALALMIKGMARAYAEDGTTFLSGGDKVNTLAAFYYGFAWLHFGRIYGLLSDKGNTQDCPFAGLQETLPPPYAVQLEEKTLRYARLLETACASVLPAPEAETAGGMFARRVIMVGTCYSRGGKYCLASGAGEAALARFSYGHGWLDAGVRAGLLTLTGNREIFTI